MLVAVVPLGRASTPVLLVLIVALPLVLPRRPRSARSAIGAESRAARASQRGEAPRQRAAGDVAGQRDGAGGVLQGLRFVGSKSPAGTCKYKKFAVVESSKIYDALGPISTPLDP